MADIKRIEKYQFTKGKSGNPKGSKKGPRLKTRLAQVLETKINVRDDDGKALKLSAADLVIDKLFEKAANGSMRAIDTILKYAIGLPDKQVKSTKDELGSVTFKITINKK